MKLPLPLMLTGAVTAFFIGSAVVATPNVATAQDSDRCGGQETPVCREVETCVGAGGTKGCVTNFYYFKSAE
jgi:hypothetical protein